MDSNRRHNHYIVITYFGYRGLIAPMAPTKNNKKNYDNEKVTFINVCCIGAAWM